MKGTRQTAGKAGDITQAEFAERIGTKSTVDVLDLSASQIVDFLEWSNKANKCV